MLASVGRLEQLQTVDYLGLALGSVVGLRGPHSAQRSLRGRSQLPVSEEG